MLEFTRGMIALRHRHPSLSRERFLTGEPDPGREEPDIRWHGTGLDAPPWEDPDARVLAFTLAGVTEHEPPLHVLLNLDERGHRFALPTLAERHWRLAVDTGRDPAVHEPNEQPLVVGSDYRAAARTVVVLEGRFAGSGF
jgi:glycogen operon protein